MNKLLLAFTALTLPLAAAAQEPVMPKPAALEAEGVPPVPIDLVERTRPYLEFRTASFLGWDPAIARC